MKVEKTQYASRPRCGPFDLIAGHERPGTQYELTLETTHQNRPDLSTNMSMLCIGVERNTRMHDIILKLLIMMIFYSPYKLTVHSLRPRCITL